MPLHSSGKKKQKKKGGRGKSHKLNPQEHFPATSINTVQKAAPLTALSAAPQELSNRQKRLQHK